MKKKCVPQNVTEWAAIKVQANENIGYFPDIVLLINSLANCMVLVVHMTNNKRQSSMLDLK